MKNLPHWPSATTLRLMATMLFVATMLVGATLGAQPRETVVGRDDPRSEDAGNARDTIAHVERVPAFVFVSLDDSSLVSHAQLEGTVYLVDFWATWCPPCVEALPALEQVYEEFHPRGFEIVSLSFDHSDERIRHFREKRFAMPWLHGRLAGGFSDIVSISFHLQNIPHYVLVGRDGRILAEADEMPADRLRALLIDNVGRGEE